MARERGASVVDLDGLLEIVDARALRRLVDVVEPEPRPPRRIWKGHIFLHFSTHP